MFGKGSSPFASSRKRKTTNNHKSKDPESPSKTLFSSSHSTDSFTSSSSDDIDPNEVFDPKEPEINKIFRKQRLEEERRRAIEKKREEEELQREYDALPVDNDDPFGIIDFDPPFAFESTNPYQPNQQYEPPAAPKKPKMPPRLSTTKPLIEEIDDSSNDSTDAQREDDLIQSRRYKPQSRLLQMHDQYLSQNRNQPSFRPYNPIETRPTFGLHKPLEAGASFPTSSVVRNRRNGDNWEHYEQTTYNGPEIQRNQQNDLLRYQFAYQNGQNQLADRQSNRTAQYNLSVLDSQNRQNELQSQYEIAKLNKEDRQNERQHAERMTNLQNYQQRVNASLAIREQTHRQSLERQAALQNKIAIRNPHSNESYAEQIQKAAEEVDFNLNGNLLRFYESQPFLERYYLSCCYDKSFLFAGVSHYTYINNKLTVYFEGNQHAPIRIRAPGYFTFVECVSYPHVLLARMHNTKSFDGNNKCPWCPCPSHCEIE